MISYPSKLVSDKTQSHHKLVAHFLLHPLCCKQSNHYFEYTALMIEAFISPHTDLEVIQFFSDLNSSLVSGCQGSPVGRTMEVPNKKRTSAFSLA